MDYLFIRNDKNTPPQPQAISHIGEAVIAAGLCDIEWPRHKPITEAHCKGSNLNEMLKARTGMKAAEWLRGQGWTKGQDGKWYSPV